MDGRGPGSGPGRRASGLWFAAATASISGVAVYVNGHGVRAFGDATAYTTWKNLVAAVVLLGVTLLARRVHPGRPVPRDRWPGLLAIGVLGGGIPFVLFFEALARADSPADAAFLHKTLVLWVAVLAVPLLAERVGALHVAAVGLLLVGQVALRGGLPSLSAGGPEVMILAATLLWSVEVILVKRLVADVDALPLGVARLGIGVVVLFAWTAATRGLTPPTGDQVGWVVLTGVLLAGYVGTWYAAIERAPVVDVMAVLVGAAIITALLARGLDGVALGPRATGLAAIAAGVATVVLAGRRRVGAA